MTIEEFKREQKNIRERVKRSRKKTNIAALQIAANMLCESHSDESEILNRMLGIILDLLHNDLTEDDKQMFVEIMKDARDDPFVHVNRTGNWIKLEGLFDIRKIARRVVWQGVYQQHLRGIADEMEDSENV